MTPLPAAPATVTGYLTELARHGAKVGTMSRRLSAIKFAHQRRNHADTTRNARVLAVWEGIRRTYTAPPEQAEPLIPPELFDVLAACPTTKTWRTPGRPPEPERAFAAAHGYLPVRSAMPGSRRPRTWVAAAGPARSGRRDIAWAPTPIARP